MLSGYLRQKNCLKTCLMLMGDEPLEEETVDRGGKEAEGREIDAGGMAKDRQINR